MQSNSQVKGFTLTELLVVIGIMALLIGISVPTLPALVRSNKVNAGLITLNETFDLARQYAISHNTFVWVLISSPSATGLKDEPLKITALASFSGTDSLNWTTTQVSVPSTALPGSDLQVVVPVQHLQGLDLQSTPGITVASLPTGTAVSLNDVGNAAKKGMNIRLQAGGKTVAFTHSIQFTPGGQAMVSSEMARYIQVVLYPQQGGTGTPNNSPNQAILRVAGLTGATSIYRN